MTLANDRLRAAAEPLKVAVWFGLIAGAARALHYLVLRTVTNDFLWTGDFVVWLAPLGHVALFALPALLLSATALIAPRLVSARTVTAVFAVLALFSFLLLFPRVHHLAWLALALGAGVQLALLISRSPKRARTLMTRAGAVIGAVTFLAAVVIQVSSRVAEKRAIQSLPPAGHDAPNVLLIILDAVRATRTSLYGYEHRTTPNIGRLGMEGVVFDRAMATTSWTLPSIASLMTGHYPTALSTDWLSPLDGQLPVLPEVLRGRGYLTGVFSANLDYLTRETGLGRGVTHFEDFRPSVREMLLTVSLAQSALVRDVRTAWQNRSSAEFIKGVAAFNWARPASTLTHERKAAQVVARDFLDWQLTTGDRPWFAMLNFFDAHAPYKPQPPFDTLFAKDGAAGAYDGAIATIDRELGKMFDELRARRELDSTIVIVTADHGELLGEHGWEHGNHLYVQLMHVPLVFRAPARVPAGVRVRHTASLRDVAATVMDLVDPAGATTPPLGGRSLRPAWEDTEARPTSPAAAALTISARRRETEPMQWLLTSLIDDSTHYIRNRDGRELLFDVRADSVEWNTLTTTRAGRRLADAMRARLDSALRVDR